MEPTDGELPPIEAELVESPMVTAVRPGPGILMSLVWWLALFAIQVVFTIVATVLVVIITFVKRGAKPINDAALGIDPLLLDTPGAPFLYFLFATFGTTLTGVGITAILYRGRMRRVLALRGLRLRQALIIAAMVPPGLVVAQEVQVLAMRVLPSLTMNDAMYAKLGEQSWIAVLLVGCLLPGLGEELYFRAFLGRGLIARHGLVFGTLAASLLFGALHINPPQVVYTAVLGMVFHLVYLWTKSLVGPVLFHALNNATSFGLMKLATSPAGVPLIDDNNPVPLPLLAGSIAGLLAASWLLYAMRTRWLLPNGREWSPGYVTAEMPPVQVTATATLASPKVLGVLVAMAGYLLFAGALAWEIRGLFHQP